MLRCIRCGFQVDEQEEFCQWCNPVVEFVMNAIEGILDSYGRDDFVVNYNWATTTASLYDKETGDDWQIEFRKE
jgi:hypothetical protein